MTNPTPGIHASFTRALMEMPDLLTDSSNPHFQSKYVSLPKLLATVRPVLAKHGLAISQRIQAEDTRLILQTVVHYEHDREILVVASYPVPLQGNPQQVGSAITYARRYSLMAALGIMGDPDDDGNLAASQPQQASQAVKPGKLTPGQASSLWDAAKNRGLTQQQLLAAASQAAGQEITRLRDLPASMYNGLLQAIEAADITDEPQETPNTQR